MPESFGARLRLHREQRQIDLSAIADQTKIKRSLLEELERGEVSHWPVGIFRRAYIRAYAHAIGLEPDVVVREFLELYPDPMEVVAAVPGATDGDGAPNSGGPPTRFGDLVRRFVHSVSSRPDAVAAGENTAKQESHVDRRPAKIRPFELDLLAAARLCTELGRADKPGEIQALLLEAARILDAIGIIVWVYDAPARGLRPALAHGYSDAVLAHLPTVGRDAHNATAAAFRSAHPCTVNGGDQTSGAIVVPLLTAAGCGGALAIELRGGREQEEPVLAFATILAAQLARSMGPVGARATRAGQAAGARANGVARTRGQKIIHRPQDPIVEA